MAEYEPHVPYVPWEEEDAVYVAVRDGATNEVEIHQRTGLSCSFIDLALTYLRRVGGVSGSSQALTAKECHCGTCERRRAAS